MKTVLLYIFFFFSSFGAFALKMHPGEPVQKMQAEQKVFSIYPNPATSFVSVTYNNAGAGSVLKVRIIDITGKEMITGQSKSPDGNRIQLTLDVSELPRGMYFAEIIADDQKVTRRINLL